jgi:hypothetical protein
MKARYLILLLPAAFAYGALTVKDKVFPYTQLQQLRRAVFGMPEMRIVTTEQFQKLDNPEAYEDRMVFVTYGQSNSANTGQFGYDVKHPVFMVYNGEAYAYADPALGGTGNHGSVWGRVGDMLVDRGITASVFFVNTGWGGASVEVLADGHQFDFFEDQLRQAQARYGRIDGILIHQGERNHVKMEGSETYKEGLRRLNARIDGLTDAPVYLAQVSYCGERKVDQVLLDRQDESIREVEGVLRGPNSDLLIDDQYRLPDRCHFSARGLDALADMWTGSIIESSEE